MHPIDDLDPADPKAQRKRQEQGEIDPRLFKRPGQSPRPTEPLQLAQKRAVQLLHERRFHGERLSDPDGREDLLDQGGRTAFKSRDGGGGGVDEVRGDGDDEEGEGDDADDHPTESGGEDERRYNGLAIPARNRDQLDSTKQSSVNILTSRKTHSEQRPRTPKDVPHLLPVRDPDRTDILARSTSDLSRPGPVEKVLILHQDRGNERSTEVQGDNIRGRSD